MKNWLLSGFALLIVCSSQAQVSFSINAGTQFSKWRGNGMAILDTLVENSGDYLKQGSITGYYVGFNAGIPLNGFIEIEPALRYSKTGTSLSKNIVFSILKNYGVDIGARVVTHRIELPVLVKGQVAKGLYVVIGPQVNYAYSNQLKLKAGVLGINVINKRFDLDNGFEEFSAAAVGGVNYRFPIGVQVQALYEYGVTRIMNITNDNVYQNSFKLGMTIPFKYNQPEEDWD